MDNRLPRGGNFLSTLLFFAICATIAILLLVTALLVWLSEAMGSFVAAALVLGASSAVLAGVIYVFSLRDALERIRTELETVYEVARMAKEGYDWVTEKLRLLLSLLRK